MKNEKIIKKICFVIPGYVTKNTGGAELQVYFISEELLKRGWEVELITFKGDDEKIKKSIYYNPKISYHYYKEQTIRSLEFWGVLKQLLKTKSHYYYQRTDYAHTGAVALFCKLVRKKMIYALAQDGETQKNRYSTQFDRSKYTSKIKAIIRKNDLFLVDKLINYGKRKSDIIVSQTKMQKKLLVENLNMDSILIPNSFISNNTKTYDKKNVILWVANIRPEKRADLFLKLVNEIYIEGWTFSMIGTLDHKRDKKMKEDINNVKNKNFKYWGSLSYPETENHMREAKILINTSSEEGFSNTFIQAWLYKVLLITLNVDPDGIIKEKKIGLCLNNNFEELKNKLQEICCDYNNFLPTIDQGYNYATYNFSLKNNIDKLENTLREL